MGLQAALLVWSGVSAQLMVLHRWSTRQAMVRVDWLAIEMIEDTDSSALIAITYLSTAA